MGHPQKPSPPRTITFFFSADPLTSGPAKSALLMLEEKVLTPNADGAVKEEVRLGRRTSEREIFILKD